MKRSFLTTYAWSLLAASSLCLAGVAVFSLYRENLQASLQREKTLSQQQIRLTEKLSEYFKEIQSETARQLVSFHEEALTLQLQRWQSEEPLIASAETVSETTEIEALLSASNTIITNIDDPESPSYLRSGYYRDNKEIAIFENGIAEPILFWTTIESKIPPQWIAGHQLSSGRPIRIARLDTEFLLNSLNNFLDELSGPRLEAKLISDDKASNESSQLQLSDSNILPGYRLSLTLEIDETEEWLAVFGYAMVAVSLALGTLCAALIVRQINHERRNAFRKTSFVTQISHEFKTPLTSISLYAELMENDALDTEKRNRYLSTISRESHRLSEMVDNILALNALELGKKHYRIRDFDLVDTINSIVADYRPSLSNSKVGIDWNHVGSSELARFDPAALRQVLINLFDNARKYAASGGTIDLALEKHDDLYKLAIEDRGPGIPANISKRVFDVFFQERSKLTDKSPGAGIGLSISRRLARDCGGDLLLDLEYKKGARFVVTIPTSTSKGSSS